MDQSLPGKDGRTNSEAMNGLGVRPIWALGLIYASDAVFIPGSACHKSKQAVDSSMSIELAQNAMIHSFVSRDLQ